MIQQLRLDAAHALSRHKTKLRLMALAALCTLASASHAARCGLNADFLGTESSLNAASDGVLLLRHSLGLQGDALTSGTAAAKDGSSAAAISDHLREHYRFHRHQHDLDGDAVVDDVDAQIAMRWMLGLRDERLTEGLTVRGRRSASEIDAYLTGGCVTPPPRLPDPVGNVLYVATNGADSANRGSASAPLATLAYACTRAQAGDTIRLAAGTFQETAQCAAKSNTRIMGAGATQTIVNAPLAWDFTADNTTSNPSGYLIRANGINTLTVDQLTLRGNASKANGALLIENATNVLLRDLDIQAFRFTGLSVNSSQRIDAQNIRIENSGYEWLPGVSTDFPSGGSVGNLGLSNIDDAVFAHIDIRTTAKHGYGVKAGSLSRTRFLHFDYDMFTFQSWNGGGPGNFDMELFGSHDRVEIAHNNFKQTVSLISFPPSNYAQIAHSIHVHHNDFDQRVEAYGIESVGDKLIIDHNWFRGTWTAMQHFGDQNSLVRKMTVFNNVADGLDSRLVGLKGRVEELRVFNNTANLGAGGINQNYLITVGNALNSERWLVANNAVAGAASKPVDSRFFVTAYATQQAPRDILFANNIRHEISSGVAIDDASHTVAVPGQWDHRYVNDVAANPNFITSGVTAYQPQGGSPLIDVGDSNVGVVRRFAGAGRDVGAFERGVSAWTRGRGSVSEIEYLQAPTTSVTDSFFVGSVNVDLKSEPGTEIRYTLDGSEPGWASTRYAAPIAINTTAKLRARAFTADFASGPALMMNFANDVRGYRNLALNRPDSAYSASSTYFQRDPQGSLIYQPKRAFDDEYTSFLGWSSNEDTPLQWVQVDLGAAKRLRFIEFFTRWSVDQADTRRDFAIRASNDPNFVTYTTLFEQGATPLAFQAVVEQIVNDATPYRYVRATKTSSGGFFVNELKVRGE